MHSLNKAVVNNNKEHLPIKILQFGEGNFLRAFIDWMVYKCNEKGVFNGRILALQNTPKGKIVPKLQAQDCLYTTILHGVVDGQYQEQCEVIDSIAEALNPYENWEKVLKACMNKDIQYVFSNTTEAGLIYQEEMPFNSDIAPQSFPGKLCQILYERYKSLGDSEEIYILPCELVEHNGQVLKEIIFKHIEAQKLPLEFKVYVEHKCQFFNTLVDRIVYGYPQHKEEYFMHKLGYKDELMTGGELFYFMAIEASKNMESKLPFYQADLNVVVSEDIEPYKLRKLRLLNAVHTLSVPAAALYGLHRVDEMMDNELFKKFICSCIFDEIIPFIKLDNAMLTSYAHTVLERFSDKALNHQLSSILMNTSSKVKSRLLPCVLDARAKGVLPLKLCFALSAYIALFKEEHKLLDTFSDDEYVLKLMHQAWGVYKNSEASALFTVKAVMSDVKLWGCDLSSDIDLVSTMAKMLHAICSDGVSNTLQDIVGQ